MEMEKAVLGFHGSLPISVRIPVSQTGLRDMRQVQKVRGNLLFSVSTEGANMCNPGI